MACLISVYSRNGPGEGFGLRVGEVDEAGSDVDDAADEVIAASEG